MNTSVDKDGVYGVEAWVKRGEWEEVVGKVVEEVNPVMPVEGKTKEKAVKR